MQHFKLVNRWIRGFVFWCHEQVTLVESRTIKDCLVSRTKKGKIRAIGFDSPINEKWNNYVIKNILHNNIDCTRTMNVVLLIFLCKNQRFFSFFFLSAKKANKLTLVLNDYILIYLIRKVKILLFSLMKGVLFLFKI